MVYLAKGAVEQVKLRAKVKDGSRPLKLQVTVTWALDERSCPRCVIDPRSKTEEVLPVKKEIQST